MLPSDREREIGAIRIGDSNRLKNGGEAKILSEFSSDSHGNVYNVSLCEVISNGFT